MACSSVDLPWPLRPTSPTRSPALDVEVEVVQHAQWPVARGQAADLQERRHVAAASVPVSK